MSATRHSGEMKKSWKRNLTSLKAWSRASIRQARPYRFTDRDKSWKGETVHYEKPQRLTQMSATRHPDQMKKSWKRNFINLKKAAA